VATTYARDTQGRLSSVTRLGRRIVITYSGTATRRWQLFGPGNTLLATYTYVSNRLDTVTYPDGSGYKYTYDGGGRILTVVDLEGKKIEAHTYVYVSGAYRAATSEIGDGVEKLTFTYQTDKTLVTDALGNVTTYEYGNKRGTRQVTKIIGPCSSCGGGGGETQEWTYDEFERITSYKDGEGNLTTYTYDPVTGDLRTETGKPDPATSLTTTYTYHPDGRLKTRQDPPARIQCRSALASGPLPGQIL
jgi:YD repeat-containing protein